MFERLKNAFGHPASTPRDDGALSQWAHERLLSHLPLLGGGFAMGGRLLDRPFRAESVSSSRAYIQGVELMAKADLGLTTEVNVILMNRALKRSLEAQAAEGLQIKENPVPEEVRWLSLYRDAGWAGPDERFWARYAVLTDAPEVARQWLDAESLEWLMGWPEPVQPETPLMFMLTRGKTYLRLQVDKPGDSAAALHALDIFEHLSGRALQLLER